jgi:uncharacterized protein (DUF608 family)
MVERKNSTAGHVFEGAALDQIAFPIGGIGAGMICLEGTGALSKFSLRHRPNLSDEPEVFAALTILGAPESARVLEGLVPTWKLRPQFSSQLGRLRNICWGLPRFREASFEARFPFATVRLKDGSVPIEVELTGWSPFSPGDADNASLPVAGLEYRFINRSNKRLDAMFSFNAPNFMAAAPAHADPKRKPSDRILPTSGGFVLAQAGSQERPWDEGYFAVWLDEPNVKVNYVWLRGERTDHLQMLWNAFASGRCDTRAPDLEQSSPGASIFVPFRLDPGEARTFSVRLAWYVPRSNLFEPSFRYDWPQSRTETIPFDGQPTYQPWYAGRFRSLEEVKRYWQGHYDQLRQDTERFTSAFYDSTLPPEVLEAVAANLTILKSPTVLRQTDGRFWGWEGLSDDAGSCYGSANHVWNYAQAMAHLFPQLERTLRETELGPNLGRDGFQAIRATLPIRPIGDTREDAWSFPSAADGQLGTIVRLHREWRISGDTAWLRGLWPKVRLSLDYCIKTWDPKRRGWIEEPHINTFDRAFWGADSLCTSLYAGALKAAILMGEALGERVEDYSELLAKAREQMETKLFNGEFFIQKTDWKSLQAPFPPTADASVAFTIGQRPEMMQIAEKEGPPYQIGAGCLADGVLGAWLCWACGVGEVLNAAKVQSHLDAVFRYNFRKSLADHANSCRPVFACGDEGGLIVCTWPKGERPAVPMIFSDEVWTGTEYQIASHLISLGKIEEGLEIVRTSRRRYDGRVRNPFDEVEAGHWYARAMSSYALLQAFSGARYDAVERTLYLNPAIPGDFRSFLATATGYGTVGVKDGQPFIELVSGKIPYRKIEYSPATARGG